MRDETIRLYGMGGKVAVKPTPSEYVSILRWAIDSGTLGPGVDAYVIPMARKQTRRGERDDRRSLSTSSRRTLASSRRFRRSWATRRSRPRRLIFAG